MHEEHEKIIKDFIKSGLEFKEKVLDDMANLRRDLFLKQLDFFLQLSSFSVAILGIGYLVYTEKVDTVFGLLSLIFSFVNILWISSYIRVSIDKNANHSEQSAFNARQEMDNAIKKAIESIIKKNSDIYFKYAEEQTKPLIKNDELSFSGEIFTFIFINSFLFLVLAFFKDKINFCFDYFIITILILIISYFLSFKDISGVITDKLSEYFTPKNKKNK